MMIQKEIKFGFEPNKNGKIYPKETVGSIVDQINISEHISLTSEIPKIERFFDFYRSFDINKIAGKIILANYNKEKNNII